MSQTQNRRNSKTGLENEIEELKLERLRNKAKLDIGEDESKIPERIRELRDEICSGILTCTIK